MNHTLCCAAWTDPRASVARRDPVGAGRGPRGHIEPKDSSGPDKNEDAEVGKATIRIADMAVQGCFGKRQSRESKIKDKELIANQQACPLDVQR